MWRVSLTIVGAAAALGCNGGSDLPVPPPEPAAHIVIIRGDAQTAAAGTQLPESLIVRVTDGKDQPVQSQRVGFAASAGTVVPATATTNADGRTGAIWVLGPVAGPQAVTATATGSGAPQGLAVTFHATATATTPTKLEKTAGDEQQATVGSPVATPPAVKVTDAGGNAVAGVPVTFAVATGGGSVNPGTVPTDAKGVAAVTAWTLGPVAGANTLTATIPGTGITGNPATFTATGIAGTAGRLAITQQPSATAQSGLPFPQQPRLQVQDAQGNPVKTAGLSVKATVASGPGAQLSGQLTVPTDANGVAAFTGLALTGPVGTYTLAFSNQTLAGVTSAAIVLGPGAAAQLVITQQPAATAQSGIPLSPQPVVQVRDPQGNPVTHGGIAVTASLNGAGGALDGTKTVTTDGTGSAAFTNLVISGSSGAYTITFSAPQLTPATSNPITIGAGAPAKLAFTQQPSNVAAGTAISPAVKVSIQDGSGNVVTSATGRVTVALGSNPGGSTLSGTSAASAVSGVATFANLSLNKPGTGYTIVATSGSLAQATSASFNVSVGPAAQIAANSATSQSAPAGTAVPAPPSVIVRDAQGNPVSGVAVTFAVTSGGGAISPTSPIATGTSGVATLTSWTLGPVAGTNTLTATIPGSGITGNPVTFTATGTVGSAAKLAITRQPSGTAQSGVAFAQQPQVQVQDAFGNPVAIAARAVTASIASGGGAALSGQLTAVTDAEGLVSFTNLVLTGPQGSYTLAFGSPTLAGTTSASIVLSGGVAAQLGIVQQPASVGQSGVLLNPQPVVEIKDAQGNPVAELGTAVTASLNGAGGSLGGTTTITTDGKGKAAFTNLVINGTAGIYSLTFNASQLASATSNGIAIGAGAALYSIEFDDGRESSYLSGLPIIEAAGYKATHFIITGLVGYSGYVTQDQVLQMYRDGDEIGAHTRTHPHLSTLSATAQQTEIQGSYDDLCGMLGRCPTSFAYPYSDFNSTTVSIVKSVGFTSARTTNKGYNGATTDKFRLLAFQLDSTTQFSQVQSFIDGAYSQKVWAVILLHLVDQADLYSVSHQFLQRIVDYLKQKDATVVTQSEAIRLMGL